MADAGDDREQGPQQQRDALSQFTTLPLLLPPTPSYPHSAQHTLYMRAHAPRQPTNDDARALFCANMPVDATAAHFKHLFATHLGGVRLSRVDFDGARPPATTPGGAPRSRKRKRSAAAVAASHHFQTPDAASRLDLPLASTWEARLHASGASCVLVFVDRASREAALKAVRKHAAKHAAGRHVAPLVWGDGVVGAPALGSQRYRAHHDLSYPDPADLQSAVDTYMAAFSEAERARARAAAAQRAVPDADGFVTVARGGRAGPARADEAQAVLERQRAREAERTAARGAFYRFQVREQMKERERALVRRFDEDRRVAEALGSEKERRGVFVPEQEQ